MNFKDLLEKMKSLEECGDEMPKAATSTASTDLPLMGEEPVEECGGPMASMGAPAQNNSVSMNVSMNGSGAGGIKDLMNILRNIEDSAGGPGDAEKVMIGMDEEIPTGGFDDATTEPNPEVADVSAVTPTGNDLASKEGEALKVNGGGNPMGESLIARLAKHYNEVKAR